MEWRVTKDERGSRTATKRHTVHFSHSLERPHRFDFSKQGSRRPAKPLPHQYRTRDKRHGKNGSILCIPIILREKNDHPTFPGRQDICVVTFRTYGTPICDSDDSRAINAVKFLGNEFAQRVCSEFLLYVMKQRRKELSKKNSKKK